MYDVKAKIKTDNFNLNFECIAKNIFEIDECIKAKLIELNYFGDYKIKGIKLKKIKTKRR